MRQIFPSWWYTACDDTSDTATISAIKTKIQHYYVFERNIAKSISRLLYQKSNKYEFYAYMYVKKTNIDKHVLSISLITY